MSFSFIAINADLSIFIHYNEDDITIISMDVEDFLLILKKQKVLD